MADSLITPTTGSLTWLGATARVITIGLVLTGFAPALANTSDPRVCLPGAGSLALTGASPDLVSMGLRLRGYPPLVASNKVTIAIQVGSLILTGAAPTATNTNVSTVRTPTTGSLTLTGNAPTLPIAPVTVRPQAGSLSTVRDLFPTTGILDLFDRADENPVNTNWDVLRLGKAECRIVSNVLRAPAASEGHSYWSSNNFGPDCEIYATVTQRPDTLRYLAFYARVVSPNSAALSGYKVYFQQSNTANMLDLFLVRIDGNNEGFLVALPALTTWADGDQVGFAVVGNVLKAWHRPNASVWRVIAQATDTTYSTSGNIGVQITDTTTSGTALDILGGGTRIQPPDAPYVQLNIGLRLTGYSPILLTAGAVRKDPLVGTLTLTGVLATVTTTQPVAITPPAGSLTITMFLGGVSGGSFVVTPGVTALQLQSTQQITPSTATALKCQPWARLDWSANTESDLAGYKVYHGIVSGIYVPADTVTLGLVTTYVFNNLPYGNNYFVVTAFDAVGNEGMPSAEVSTFISGSGFAPTLTNSSPAIRIPTPGALTMTGSAPSIQAYQVPTTVALTLTGAAPFFGSGIVVPPGSLTLTGAVSLLSGISTIMPSAGTLTVTGVVATVLEQGTFVIRPGVGSLTLTGLSPTIPSPWLASLAINANQMMDAGGSPLDA